MDELKREVEKELEKSRRMVVKAKRGEMKAEDETVIMSLALERKFDPFAVLWYWLFFICSLCPLIIWSIFVGGVWHKSYTQNVIARENLGRIFLKRAAPNPKEFVC